METKVDFVKVTDETTLKCPVCGFEYMHMAYVKVQRRNDTTIVTEEGTSMKASRNKGRGTILTLGYTSECGHAGELIFQFHKGMILVMHKPLPYIDIKDIWRD